MSASTKLRLADLDQNAPNPFEVTLDVAECARLAEALGLSGLRKTRLIGSIRASGRADWQLDAQLGATVVQPCVVTLDPVTTRIDVPIQRHYLADHAEPEDTEVEMDANDSVEPLRPEIDLYAVLSEALSLHLPAYPRKSDANLEQTVFAPPGTDPLTDEKVRPFAGLSALKEQLDKKS